MLKPILTFNVHCRPSSPPCGYDYDFLLASDPTQDQYEQLRQGLNKLIKKVFGDSVETFT